MSGVVLIGPNARPAFHWIRYLNRDDKNRWSYTVHPSRYVGVLCWLGGEPTRVIADVGEDAVCASCVGPHTHCSTAERLNSQIPWSPRFRSHSCMVGARPIK